ncbi:hypothetical protein GCM10027258_26950 [Amycolatopsis stemonae]
MVVTGSGGTEGREPRPDPISRAYYDRTRAEGKEHNAALICLGRHRCDVLDAVLRNGTRDRQGPCCGWTTA